MGRVYLVGAGPGDEGLITVRGLHLLQSCDAVVYDRLSSEQLLAEVKEGCHKIYVGKQAGYHSKTQEEISRILIECAGRYETVVRLKGGDSFVFGRGGEEIEALMQEEIPFEVIPGVTSAVAVPECAGIPVTHRGVSRSFHVITGHTDTAQGQPVCDYPVLAKTEGTLVFLMGLTHLGEIVRGLVAAGKEEKTKAAVISEGTTAKQQTVRGTLADIEQKVRESAIISPAVIVVGETARFEFLYQENGVYIDRKKMEKRVGITATPMLYQKLESGFRKAEMQTVPVCTMEVKAAAEPEQLAQELQRLEQYQWILFTSSNGVIVFFDTLKREQVDIRKLGHLKFAVIGSGTGDKLKEYGIYADFIPSYYTVSVLAREFSKKVEKGEHVLIPRAAQGSAELTEVLRQNGIDYTDLAVYDVSGSLTEYADRLEELDYLLFASASGVKAFFTGISERQITLPEKLKIACIGEVTKSELEEKFYGAGIVADVPNVQGLIEAVAEYEQKSRGESNDTHEKVTCK